jgi:hypothetical protein
MDPAKRLPAAMYSSNTSGDQFPYAIRTVDQHLAIDPGERAQLFRELESSLRVGTCTSPFSKAIVRKNG